MRHVVILLAVLALIAAAMGNRSVVLASPADTLASVTPNPNTVNSPPPPSEQVPWKQVIQFGLLILIGMASLALQCFMLSRAHATPEDIIKGSTLILIIILSVSALIFGFDDKQIAPVVGLFGTIIGFLLGKTDNRGSGRDAIPQKQDAYPAGQAVEPAAQPSKSGS